MKQLSTAIPALAGGTFLRPWGTAVILAADDDIKIFPSGGRKPIKGVDSEQEDAEQFVRQRDNGNIARAKRLGARYARHLRRLWRPGETLERVAQKKVLYAYTVTKIIEERSPNSFLEQAALVAFHQRVQNRSQADYDTIVDSTAFTLYLLAERNHRTSGFGRVFADLSGQGHDPSCQKLGEELYLRYLADCAAVFDRAGYRC